ncbi:4-hydroxythreonine-4-phosphate dehydrogenase PdxA, partial [Candidatus Pelagibacter sp. HIMB1517]|uniref:4-hydroxythreonine-4-phosphate dehydrogenase PdxA n=1 Tax=Candidatus Pelagibacter sp. HIMB1517 TaxID=3413341 RepID=UPI003F83D194
NKSISEQIIIKSLNKIKKSKLKKVYFIGDKHNFKKLYKKSLIIKKIIFIQCSSHLYTSDNYIKNITKISIDLHNNNKIDKIINMPLNKKKYLKLFPGFTEFFSETLDKKKNENMIMYSEKFSTCPLTTHVEIRSIYKKINKKNLRNCIENIINFYKKIIKKKITIVVLGINPHASKDMIKNTKDFTIIKPIIEYYKKKGVDILGPVSADTAFTNVKNKIFIGMYHDQALIPFKILNKFNGINVTIGKKIIRMSPDHGTGVNIINKKKIINNQSFIKCIEFCENY